MMTQMSIKTFLTVFVINVFRGGFKGGSRGSLEPPFGAKFFHFHEEFQEF